MSGQLDSASGDLFQSHAPQVTGACLTHSTSIHSNFKGESLTEQGNFIAEVEHELQMDRWRSLFISMEAVLNMEGEKLESWLKNVQKMQAHCFGATKRLQPGQLPLFNTWMASGTAANQSCYGQTSNTVLSATMAMQQELAQTASAASIASTANFAKRMQGPMKTVAV
ncbi:hypothetical protein O6H91_Y447500 [Diphasiastrum complanatum]|nr:hypothetical protein O6H91_Y447500 [Diphasiastrum complanatum]